MEKLSRFRLFEREMSLLIGFRGCEDCLPVRSTQLNGHSVGWFACSPNKNISRQRSADGDLSLHDDLRCLRGPHRQKHNQTKHREPGWRGHSHFWDYAGVSAFSTLKVSVTAWWPLLVSSASSRYFPSAFSTGVSCTESKMARSVRDSLMCS